MSNPKFHYPKPDAGFNYPKPDPGLNYPKPDGEPVEYGDTDSFLFIYSQDKQCVGAPSARCMNHTDDYAATFDDNCAKTDAKIPNLETIPSDDDLEYTSCGYCDSPLTPPANCPCTNFNGFNDELVKEMGREEKCGMMDPDAWELYQEAERRGLDPNKAAFNFYAGIPPEWV